MPGEGDVVTLTEAKEHGSRLIKKHEKALRAAVEAGFDPMDALRECVRQENAILMEVARGQTPRAKRIREAIFEKTWEALRPKG